MAFFRLSVSTFSRATGRTAVGRGAYISGSLLIDAAAHQAGEALPSGTGVTHDYRGKDVTETWIKLPAGASEQMLDRQTLWRSADAAETRTNSRVGREWLVTLPHELTYPERRELVEKLANELVERYGCAVDVAIHRGQTRTNHHAHLLCSTRRLEGSRFTLKTRKLDDRVTGPAEITSMRAFWADTINDALAIVPGRGQVSPLSYRARGIDRLPTLPKGKIATDMDRAAEARGEGPVSELGRANAARVQRNELVAQGRPVPDELLIACKLDTAEARLERARKVEQARQEKAKAPSRLSYTSRSARPMKMLKVPDRARLKDAMSHRAGGPTVSREGIANLARVERNKLLAAGRGVPVELDRACQPMSATRRAEPSLVALFAALARREMERLIRAVAKAAEPAKNTLELAVAKMQANKAVQRGQVRGMGR